MTISMIVLICFLGVVTLLAVAIEPRNRKPSRRWEVVGGVGRLFLGAWALSEFGSFAGSEWGIEIGYWQAFFLILALNALRPIPRDSWTEYSARQASE